MVEVQLQSDVAVNDSDKSFTVPDREVWEIVGIFVTLISTATAGNREVKLEIQDGGSVVIAEFTARAVQAASLTRKYQFAPCLQNESSFASTDELQTAIPCNFEVNSAWVVRVYDAAAIDPAADDMTVQMIVRKRNG